MGHDPSSRAILPIPHRVAPGLTTYDAKDPDTAYPPIVPLTPPKGAPNVLVILLDDVGFGASSAFGGPCATPTAERLAAGGLKFNRFHTTALCAPTQAGHAHRPQPPLRRDGQHHRDRDLGPGELLGAAQQQGAGGADPEAQRLLHRPVRQVPRGARVAVVVDGAVRRLALGRWRLRDVLRVHRWGEQPVRPGALRRHDPGRAARHGGGGLPPHRGPGGPGHRLGAPAEGPDARQAVLRLLRAGSDARAAPRPVGVGRQVRRPVRRRAGTPSASARSRGRRSSASSPRTRT